MKKNLLIAAFFLIFFHRGYAAQSPVPGESLWCITKQIGNTLNIIESSLDVLNAALSFNDYLVSSELSVLISLLDQMPSIIDPLVSIADIFSSEVEYAASVFDIAASKAADISSKIDLLTLCEPHAITASTTINAAGSYCLCNDVGTITIDADDVVLDLRSYTISSGLFILSHDQIFVENGVVEGAGSLNALTVSSGASNITISQILARNAITGMELNGVSRGLIEYCEMVGNTTGLALINSNAITIDHGIARSNTQSGFSLVQSFTNYVHDCKSINSGLGNSNVLTNNVYGFVSQNGTANIFENCIANATQALSTTDYNSIVAGFALTGTEYGTKIIGCEAANAITSANGVTVPYGIYMQPQFDGLISVTSERPGNGAAADEVDAQAWTSDGIYLAVAGNFSGSNKLVLYEYDRTNQVLVQINAYSFGDGSIASIAWSADNRYLLVGGDSSTHNLVVYSFDPTTQSLTIANSLTIAGSINAVAWSPDSQNIVVGGDFSGNNIILYRFNRVTYQLTQTDTKSNGGSVVLSVTWSPNGRYVAAGYENTSDTLQLYTFSIATGLLTLVDTKVFGVTDDVRSLSWSPDGNYLAAAGIVSADSLLIYQLNSQTNTLNFVTSNNQAPEGLSLSWSPDGQFLAMGSTGLSSINIAVYRFDRGARFLFLRSFQNLGVQISSLAWSPDGRSLAVGAFGGSSDSVRLYRIISFPSDNVIKDNVVYCNSGSQFPSGVGISGSSICNMIIQNTAYSNPLNPRLVSTNYQFVCNVFNQLFGTEPSLMQNISLGSCEPIAIQDNVALLLQQAIASINLDESMIDIIESTFNTIQTSINVIVPPCSPTPINQATTITSGGVYCLQNNINGTIVIQSDDVVLDLSGRLLTGSIQIASVDGVTIRNGTIDADDVTNSDGIEVQSGSRNITIHDLLIRNALHAISCDTVVGAVIKNCEMTSNTTGFQAISSYNISIEDSIARANTAGGFSFVASCTNTVRNSKALDTGLGNTTPANARVFGFFASNGSNNIFENCISNATQALSTTDFNSVIAGFALAGTEKCTKIIACEAAHATTGINSFSLPYGIWLENQLSGLVTLTLQSTGSASDSVSALSWTSDNAYLLAGGTLSGGDVKIYQFNSVTSSFVATVTTIDLGSTATVFAAAWNPNNTTFAVGGDLNGSDVRIFTFDPTNQTALQVALADTGATTDIVYALAWSPNGKYLAVGGALTTNDFRIYQYDSVTNTLTQIISQSTGAASDTVRTIMWSPDSKYVALGGTMNNAMQVYSFVESPVAVTLAVLINFPGDTVRSVAWSPDGYYLAIGGSLTSNGLRMYQFTRIPTAVSFPFATLTAGPATVSGSSVYTITWSDDGQMIAVGGLITGADTLIYRFDRAVNSLTLLQSVSPGGTNTDFVQALAWSPDGRSLAMGGTFTGVDLVLCRALQFPSDNVIMNNTIYCNSGSNPVRGVGISGSSTCNYIVGNTSYSNPINPTIVNANNTNMFVDMSYTYVCNVYNQLFGTGPTLLQNIGLSSNQPIQTQPNVALLIKQTQALLAPDITLLDSATSIVSVIQSKINNLNTASLCDAIVITSLTGTTITASGSYCLANNTTGTIAINADTVVLNLNNNRVTGSIAVGAQEGVTIENGMVVNTGTDHGIDVQAGAQNIAIQDVLIRGAICGIRLTGVDTGTIERCELVQNTTGIEIDSSCNIAIDKTNAYSNIQSGFSLVSSFTNTISNSKALSTGENNTQILTNNVYGFVSQNGFSNIFENCIANATQALSTTDYNSIVAGFAFTGTENGSKIIGCEAANAQTNARGVTVPYGIYMQPQLDGLISVTAVNPGGGSYGDVLLPVVWSPDGIYLATGGAVNGIDSADLIMYQFDRTTQSLIEVASAAPVGSTNNFINTISWSPDGNYLAVGIDYYGTVGYAVLLYKFDRSNLALTQVFAMNPQEAPTEQIRSLVWSPDGQYFAISGLLNPPTGNGLEIYKFNSVAQTLTFVTSINPDGGSVADTVWQAVWSPDGLYLAVGGAISGISNNDLFIYRFDRATQTLIEITSINPAGGSSADTVLSIAWSPDGQYLAIGGVLSGNDLLLYRFERSTQLLTEISSVNPGEGAADTVQAVSWSFDGQYIVIGGAINGSSGNDIVLYRFDRGSQTLTQVASAAPEGVTTNAVAGLSWSPDGQYIAIGGSILGNPGNDLIIYRVLSFPYDNVIKDNTVYCNSGAQFPSGVGISGSSICNMIIQNTAYSNPINPSIVSSNYVFVCNAFNQLFGVGPSLLQNVTLGTCEPIQSPENVALLIKQAAAGLSFFDQRVVSLQSALITAPCNPVGITSPTTISSSGSYCLAQNIAGTITISASDVTLDLSGRTITGSIAITGSYVTVRNGSIDANGSGDAIAAQSGSSILISNVSVRNATRGIALTGVQHATVEQCHVTLNTTGVELTSCANVIVDDTIATNNFKSGFSLVTSYTNTIINCQALSTGLNNSSVVNNNVYGFVSQNGFSNIFENCIANATQAISTTDYNSIVAGFALTGTENGTKIIECEAANAATSANGVTVPHGIYLQPQIDGLISVTGVNPGGGISGGEISTISWSPDGQYLAAGGGIYGTPSNDVVIYQFDRNRMSLVSITSINPGPSATDTVIAVAWSPDGQYLAVGGDILDNPSDDLIVYRFNPISSELIRVASANSGPGYDDVIRSVAWSPDGQYLAVGGGPIGGDDLILYAFNRVSQSLSEVFSVNPGGTNPDTIRAVAWSPDGLYLAVGGDIDSSDDLILYQFNRSSQTLVQVDTENASVNTLAWSSDGQYLAVGGGSLQVYRLNRTLSTLEPLVSNSPGTVRSVAWSPDGQYVVVGGSLSIGPSSDDVVVYRFDRGAQTLNQLASASPGGSGGDAIEIVTWSPDGHYVAVGGNIVGSTDSLIVYAVLSFPYDNVIKNNLVYCNSGAQFESGVGISGPSICNYIIGNTAYSNPINPPVVSSNYQFVCNVFNQLFQNMPTLMQNISLGGCEAIATPYNVAMLLQQAIALVDDLGACGPTAILPSGSYTISTSGNYCLSQDAVSDIVISGTCVYLDLSEHCVTGVINVTTSDDVIIANGYISPAAPADSTAAAQAAISILSGAQYTQINNVVITCADTTVTSVNGRTAISIAGGNAYVSNCTITSGGVANGVTASATPGAGGDGIAITSTATRAFVRDCMIFNTGSGGTATAGNTGGRAGHGFFVQNSATNSEIINCVVKQTGTGGNTSGAGTGGAGGNGITIQSGAVDTAVNSCTFSNMGSGGTGGTTPGVDGKAVSDAVTTTANLSIIYKNFAHNILNPTKFDIQALGETGVLSPNPPDATVLNPFANIYTTP